MAQLGTFWRDKRVLITGHTGFKGAWLTLWLQHLGANVHGYAKDIPTRPSLYRALHAKVPTTWGDICDCARLKKCMRTFKPEIVIHLAAQALVRPSYQRPIETFAANTLGTAHVLEALRTAPFVKAAVLITTDKVYANNEKGTAFKELDPLGGYDPYSASKAAAEIVIASYRDSFFNTAAYGKAHRTLIASARAGNVIGGGDFAADRLIPDFIRALTAGEDLYIRNPKAIRPWQHVLEPLYGYLVLAEKLYKGKKECAGAFNFGPKRTDARTVEWIAKELCSRWPEKMRYKLSKGPHPHEAQLLDLDWSKAKKTLQWSPVWDLSTALTKVIEWTVAYQRKDNVRGICLRHIHDYMEHHI